MTNPLAHFSDHELVAQHSSQGVNTHFLTEMLRRHKESSDRLGKLVVRLTWVLVGLTVVLVFLAIPPAYEFLQKHSFVS